MLKKPSKNSEKASLSVSDYVQGRINEAEANGFNSTKIWIKNHSFDEAVRLLNEGMLDFKVVQTEPYSSQLLVSW